MKLEFSLILAYISIANALQVRKHEISHNWQLPTTTPQCCQSKGGHLCGQIVVDCCKNGCQQGYFGSQWCDKDEILKVSCDTCTSICKDKGGIVCASNLLTGMNIQCCKASDCQGNLDRSCKSGTNIDLGKCNKSSFIELAGEKIL